MGRNFATVIVNEKAEKALRGGHPWVYGAEVTAVEGEAANGDIVDVRSGKGKYLGSGFFNRNSKILVRVISRNANDRFDEAFFERRLRHALDYRRTVMGADFACCRLIFGEADYFPGWTVDRFGSVLVIQTLLLGLEQRKNWLIPMLVSILREYGEEIEAVYERNDASVRALEGLEQFCGFFVGEGLRDDLAGVCEIVENGIRYRVDYRSGQKTGFFLDQKYNRQAVGRLAAGKRVLDCFTHTGAFALNAAAGGAESVCAVDVSADALALAREHAVMNGLDGKMSFVCADVFELLDELLAKGGTPYDFIILDPPAFTKSNATLHNAIKGYREINRKAMQLLPRGGYLATCSCSHFMRDTYFRQMLHDASADAGVTLR